MPPHLITRGPKKILYIADGKRLISLHTSTKSYALQQLESYIRDGLHIRARQTVAAYYMQWIALRENMIRPALLADYRQHFRKAILPAFGEMDLSDVDLPRLRVFQARLMLGMKPASARNIIDGSFRAMWRAVRAEGVVKSNPFEFLEWPRSEWEVPDPFTAEERDAIVAWWFSNDLFYYPWVFFQFHTGCRPSETAALQWPDVNFDKGTVAIVKSLVFGKQGPTKTQQSRRIIPVSEAVMMVLSLLPSRDLGLPYVFVNKDRSPITKHWAGDNWGPALKVMGIRHRKFYATRHTFITEALKAGNDVLNVARYVGTSLPMIQKSYCGQLGLALTNVRQVEKNPLYSRSNHQLHHHLRETLEKRQPRGKSQFNKGVE